MYQIERLEKKPIAGQVEDMLMEYILKKPVAIGERIPNEYELSSQFGVGRSSVREAVKSLESKRVLEIRRGFGTFVISTQKLEDDPLGISRLEHNPALSHELLQLRFLLEPELAASAAKYASEAEKAELRRLCGLASKMQQDPAAFAEYDCAFHTRLARCSHNRVAELLIPILVSSGKSSEAFCRTSLLPAINETHAMITDAITVGDGDGARYAMVMHLNHLRMGLQGKSPSR